MNKIGIVVKSEFLRKVKSKGYIVTTLLGPILLVAFYGIIGLVAYLGMKSNEETERTIAVIDRTEVLLSEIQPGDEASYTFEAVPDDEDAVRQRVVDGEYDAYMVIPQSVLQGSGDASYFSLEGGGGAFTGQVGRRLTRAVENYRLAQIDAPEEVKDIFGTRVGVDALKLSSTGETEGDTGFYTAVGFVMGFLLYIFMLGYGSMVMQSVVEEKMSRVLEVVVSSVKPFELLMGKVLGIGLAGLLQATIWILILVGGTAFAGVAVASFMDTDNLMEQAQAAQTEMVEQMGEQMPAEAAEAQAAMMEQAVGFEIPQIPIRVFVWFLVYFLGGYLLYSSLFAAVGSSIDQIQDAQGFTIPLMMPVIIAFALIFPIAEAPNTTLAVVTSLIPFFSPLLMVVRLAVTEVPMWQLLASVALLIATFVGAIWVSARIYRVGILMYGKKPTIKDLVKWVRYA
ncbi:MAG: ABC transporter permease [Bacteroidota bacterium]